MVPNIFGTEQFQYNIPILYAELYLFGNGMEFEIKGYNGAEVKALKEGRKNSAYGGIMRNIPAFVQEDYAANYANNVRIDYLLKGFDWQGLSASLMAQTYTPIQTKDAIKLILKEEVQIDQSLACPPSLELPWLHHHLRENSALSYN